MDGTETRARLAGAGLPEDGIAAWIEAQPEASPAYRQDADAFSRYWRLGAALLARLPEKAKRATAEQDAAAALLRQDRAARDAFLAAHADSIYRELTRDLSRFLRVDRLSYDAAALIPGLAPTRAAVAAEAERLQRDKDGIEIDQGLFLSRVLAHPACGTHLCHAMLLPTADAEDRLAEFRAKGVIELGNPESGGATLRRQGRAAILLMRNPRFLNAEDESTLDPVETAVDVAILDRECDIAVLRGGEVEHPKYRGRKVFSTGINLTHLYHGKISYLWYALREMGFVNKLLRGLASPGETPDDVSGFTIEKPWIAAIDAFAIGGGCQYLLTMDYVLAARDAYLTLPARKEGIIPGAANLRLARFTGDRIARQLVMAGRRLECDSPEGRMICDEIAAPEAMDGALARIVDDLTSSGVVSAAGNRRAFRVGHEPLDLFRRYMAVYAREQAWCHFSPALIANLKRHWSAQQRKP